MTRASTLALLAAHLLAALAGGWMLPAFGAAPAAPTIGGYAATNPRGVSITSAPPGAPVLIEGANFGSATGTIAFGGIPAPQALSWSATEILAIVPTAPSYPFQGSVTVTANGQTAGGPAFTITPPPGAPAISGYAATNPRGAPISSAPPGAPMLIEGQNLGTSGTVAFNGIPSPPASWSPTEILVTVPAPPSYPFTGSVTVTANGQSAKGPSFTITPPPPPPPPLSPGPLDAGFGMDGTVLTDFGSIAGANALALQPNGQIVAAGSAWADGKYKFALARYNASGSLDNSFGTGGEVLTDLGGSVAQAVAVQPDGRIVAAGWSYANGRYNIALARYAANGSLDASFGSGGGVLTSIGESAGASAVVLQPDGRILVAGEAEASGKVQFALARYNSDGSLDTAFDSTGTVLTDFGGTAAAYAVALEPNGQIVAAGSSGANGKYGFALARYNANGSLDTAFGTGGQVLTELGRGAAANAVAVQADGQIVVAGGATAADGTGDFALARYDGHGVLDSSFGTGGKVLIDFGGDEGASAVAVQPDGRIVLAGSSDANGNLNVALARCNPNGSPDNSFGTAGRVLTDFGGNSGASAVALQPDGQIVAAGWSDASGYPEFALARYRGR